MIIGNISRGQRINEAWQRDYAKNVKIHIFYIVSRVHSEKLIKKILRWLLDAWRKFWVVFWPQWRFGHSGENS